MVRLDSELFHAACDIMRTRDAQLAALGDDELMHYGRKGMKWNENIYAEDEEKKRRASASSGQSQYAKQLQAEANRRRYGGSAYNDPKPKRPPIPAASRLPEEPEPITGLEKRFDNSASEKADYYRNKYGSQSSSSTSDDVENGRRIREQQRAQREAAAKYGGPAYTPSQKDLDKLNEDNRRANAEKQIERANAMRSNGINGQSEEQKNLDEATRIAREKGKTVLYDQHGGTEYDPHGLPVDMYVKTNSVTPEGIKTSTYGSTTFDLENPENLSTKFARKEAREYGDIVTNNVEINRKKREALERQKTNAQAAMDRANQLRDARTHDRNVLTKDNLNEDTRDISYMTPEGNKITKNVDRSPHHRDSIKGMEWLSPERTKELSDSTFYPDIHAISGETMDRTEDIRKMYNDARTREQQRARQEVQANAKAKYAGSVYTPGKEELARYKKSADIAKKPYESRERANQIRDAREHDRNVLSSDKFSNANVEKATSNHEVSYTTPSGNRITKTQEMPREPQYYKDQQSRRAQNDRGEDLEKLLKNIDLWKQKKK